jgi:zinc/manganese transport system ATP-binding protein
MTVIAFRDVSLVLGGRTILENVTLEIGDDEFIGLLGPNGAGKTTLLRAILGLILPSHGTIDVLGKPARRGNPQVGYIPQLRTAAGVQLSGRDFVAGVINGHRLGLPLLSKADGREVDRALDLVGARHLQHRPITEISGGERQRLLLAQALIGRPQLLLLDEPLMSLDLHHQRGIIELTKALQVELGISVIFSAHELNPLLGTLDRVLYLGNGQAALGSVEEVITAPVLSRLYGTGIEVVRLDNRIFVMAGAADAERDDHQHDHGHHHDEPHSHA